MRGPSERAGAPRAGEPPDITDALMRSGLIDVSYVIEDSPVGRLLLAATDHGLVRVHYLIGEDAVDRAIEGLAAKVSPRVVRAPLRLDGPRRELEEFFAGRRREFEIALDPRLIRPGFTRRVLEQTARIPFGTTVSYRTVASLAGNERAFRAAGSALGSNPLPIVVPCHRVLHSGGGLGGYTGGLDIKRRLLAIEGVLPEPVPGIG